MNILSIHPFWLTLLVIVGIACFSVLLLSLGLIIGASREKPVKMRFLKEKTPRIQPPKTPDIMGASQPVERQTQPNAATISQPEESKEKPPTFAREIPSGELDRVFGEQNDERDDPDPDPVEEDTVDWQAEEADMQAHRAVETNEFATGVSFGELGTVSVLLQKEELKPDEQNSVATTAAKLAHTDLWDKMMKALPGANEKIAKMLDPSSRKIQPAGDWKSFDIRNFV